MSKKPSLRSRHWLFWSAKLLAVTGTTLVMVAYSQQQVIATPNHVIELKTVVSAPASSVNLGSNVNVAANDQVQWVVYTGAPNYDANLADPGFPQTVNGTIQLPTGFTYNANSFQADTRTGITVVSGTSISWEQIPARFIVNTQTATSITTSLDIDLGKYFQCDKSRDTLVSWDKIRIDHNAPTNAGTTISVAVEKSTSTGYTPLLVNATALVISTGLNKWIDISSVPKEERNLRFKITFRNPTGIQALNGTENSPIDVVWKGDQPQVCVTATAPAALTEIEYTTQAELTFKRASTPLAAATSSAIVGQRFVPSNNSHTGFGAAPLIAYLVGASSATFPVILQSEFNMKDHTGELQAYNIDNSKIALGPYASASSTLNVGLSNGPVDGVYMANRAIYTTKILPTQLENYSLGQLPFTWAKLGAEEITALNKTFTFTNGVYQYSDSFAQDRLNYLRGRPAADAPAGLNARPRTSILGPIVNSSPALLPQTPQIGYPETQFPGYAAFRRADSSNRTTAHALVGSHNGMLHGFKVSTDSINEAFSYIPSFLLAKAHRLTNGDQRTLGLSPFSQDSTPMVRDIALSETDPYEWRTVVVQSLGRGNRGIYAIDAGGRFTAAERAAPGNPFRAALWEYTNESLSPTSTASGAAINLQELKDLGEMVYQPPIDPIVGAEQIVRLSNGSNYPKYDGRWAAVVGNGINSQIGPNPSRNGTGRAVLYLFYFGPNNNNKPAKQTWLRIPVSETDATLAFSNGLLSPRPYDLDSDGTVDLIYAGDIQGNMWRFDVGDLTAVKITRLFRSINGAPILAAPVVRPFTGSTACKSAGACQMLVFGTGYPASPLTPGPLTYAKQQYLYGIVDMNTNSQPIVPGEATDTGAAVVKATDLVAQTISNEGTSTVRQISNNSIDWSNKKGWTIALWEGEQTIANLKVQSDNSVLITTGRYWPFVSTQGGYKTKKAWLNQVDMYTGGGKKVFSDNVTAAASISINTALYESPTVLPSDPNAQTEQLVFPITGQSATSGNEKFGMVTRQKAPQLLGRLSWREVFGEN